MGATKIRFPQNVGIGIKPVSAEGTKRLVRKSIQYAIDQDLPSVTLVHKGNIMKVRKVLSVIGATNLPWKSLAVNFWTVALGQDH